MPASTRLDDLRAMADQLTTHSEPRKFYRVVQPAPDESLFVLLVSDPENGDAYTVAALHPTALSAHSMAVRLDALIYALTTVL